MGVVVVVVPDDGSYPNQVYRFDDGAKMENLLFLIISHDDDMSSILDCASTVRVCSFLGRLCTCAQCVLVGYFHSYLSCKHWNSKNMAPVANQYQ